MGNRKKANQPSNSTPIPQDHSYVWLLALVFKANLWLLSSNQSAAADLRMIVGFCDSGSGLESAKTENGGDSLPQKFWFKQQFAMGVNEVTRVLERMSPPTDHPPQLQENPKSPSVQLQAVLVASDCNPRWLTRHLPSLASSRKVPLLFIKGDQKGGGSLRLGELVNLKTAIAVGVKVKGNAVNQCLKEHLLLLRSNEMIPSG
ncbi:hypothetical protein LINGRAHAP2_LOCUS15047 [Linum grandiflorum]